MKKPILTLALTLALVLPVGAEVSLMASGEGTTRDAAVTSALRHAIEQAVGVRVDADTQVRNFETLRDRVYLRSAGFIRTYRVVSEEPFPGGVRVTVLAVVAEEALKSELAPFAGQHFDGAAAVANARAERDRQREDANAAAWWLREALERTAFTYAVEVKPWSEREVLVTLSGVQLSVPEEWHRRFTAFLARVPLPDREALESRSLRYPRLVLLDEKGERLAAADPRWISDAQFHHGYRWLWTAASEAPELEISQAQYVVRSEKLKSSRRLLLTLTK